MTINLFTFMGVLGLAVLAVICLTALADYIRLSRKIKRAMLAGTALAIITCSSCAQPPQIGAPALQRQPACEAINGVVTKGETEVLNCALGSNQLDLLMGAFAIHDITPDEATRESAAIERCNHAGGKPVLVVLDKDTAFLYCRDVDV